MPGCSSKQLHGVNSYYAKQEALATLRDLSNRITSLEAMLNMTSEYGLTPEQWQKADLMFDVARRAMAREVEEFMKLGQEKST